MLQNEKVILRASCDHFCSRDSQLSLTFQVMSGSDPRDRVTAYSSPDKQYRLCGTEPPPPITSSGVLTMSCLGEAIFNLLQK